MVCIPFGVTDRGVGRGGRALTLIHIVFEHAGNAATVRSVALETRSRKAQRRALQKSIRAEASVAVLWRFPFLFWASMQTTAAFPSDGGCQPGFRCCDGFFVVHGAVVRRAGRLHRNELRARQWCAARRCDGARKGRAVALAAGR